VTAAETSCHKPWRNFKLSIPPNNLWRLSIHSQEDLLTKILYNLKIIAGTKYNSPKNFKNVKSQEAKGEEGGEDRRPACLKHLLELKNISHIPARWSICKHLEKRHLNFPRQMQLLPPIHPFLQLKNFTVTGQSQSLRNFYAVSEQKAALHCSSEGVVTHTSALPFHDGTH